MNPTVEMTRRGAIAVLTVSNPTIKNALTLDMAARIHAACDEIDADESVGAVVLRGADGTFCSGADTSSWRDSYADDPLSDRAYAETDTMYGSFVRVGRLQVPVVAAVRGAAVGAGLNLALAADLRVVADDARILAGFLRAGIHPGGGFFTLVRRVAGTEAAAALGLFSQELDGRRAYEVGLASECVPDDKVEQVAFDLAGGVAADPLLARRVKRSFVLETADQSLSWPVALELERGVQLWTQHRRLVGREKAAGAPKEEA